MKAKFSGTGVALVTPFRKQGTIDFTTLENLVETVIKSKVDYIVALGTTSEAATMNERERTAIIDNIIEVVKGRVPIVLGLGGNNTLDIVDKIKNMDFTGIDGILSVSPYYNKPQQRGIYLHYKSISEVSPVPIIMYNVPGRTGVNMHPETTARLALECKNIVGFKAASVNLEQIKRLLEIKPDTLDVLSGDDALTYEIMKAGGVGVISVFGNVYPKEFVAFVRLMQQGRYNDAKVLNESYSEVYKLLFADGNPAGAKAQLSNMGYIKNVLRLPLVPANEEVREALREAGEKLQAGSILY
jgi:4-hydroxy-tetrahydrodipicolinate synthase